MGQSVSFQDDDESPQQRGMPGSFLAHEEVDAEIPDMTSTEERMDAGDVTGIVQGENQDMSIIQSTTSGGEHPPASNSLAAVDDSSNQATHSDKAQTMAGQAPIRQDIRYILVQGNASIGEEAVVAGGDVLVNRGLNEEGVRQVMREEIGHRRDETERQRQREEERQKVEQQRKEIRDWFAPEVKFHTIQQENHEKWTDGTLTWFTDREDYKAWKNGEPRIIWGTGIPGAGKTVLASRIISDLKRLRESSPKKICIVFAFCRYSEPLKVNDILEALVKQFLQADSSLADLAESLYKQHVENKTRPTQRELLDLLRQMEHRFDIVFYVIDGLDEALVDTQFDLILAIKGLRGQFALTSRPVQTLQAGLPTTKFYSVRAHHYDIIRLVVQKVERNPGFHSLLRRHSYLDRLVQRVAAKSNGMFLHAALQIEFVQHCPTIAQLKDALNRFPAKIEDLYVETMKRINEQQKPKADLANRVLLWLVFGREALDFLDLQQALRLTLPNHDGQVHKDDLLSACCGLVTVEENTDLVRLVHFTAHESLPPLLKKYLPEPHGLLFLATTRRLIECGIPTNAMRFKTWDDLWKIMRTQKPLLRYSYDHWAYHAQESMAIPRYVDAVRQFVRQCTSFPSVIDRDLVTLSPLHVAARYGFHEILDPVMTGTVTVDVFLGHSRPWTHIRKDPVNRRDSKGWTALVHAVVQSHGGVVERLLAHQGTNVNISDLTGRTALIHAVQRGCYGALERLLAHQGTNVNISDITGRTALIHAVQRGWYGALDRLLAHKDTDANIADDAKRTALIHAVKLRHEGAVERLLEHEGTDVNIPGRKGWTALIYAVWECESAVERLLAHQGTDVNIADENRQTALIHAVKRGHEGALKSLLAHRDTDVNKPDREGWTALMHAVEWGRDGAFERLLAHKGANVNIADKNGRTALIHASERGHEVAVKRLLSQEGTDVNKRDREGRTALIHAAEWNHEPAVAHLLAHEGTAVNIADQTGQTALIYAAERGHDGAVERLLAYKGTNVNFADSTGRTALMYAVERGRERAVAHLLAHKDTDVNIIDNTWRSALIHGVKWGHEDAVKRLLAREGTDVNKRDREGRTALMHAMECDNELAVAHLLAHEATDVNVTDSYGLTALMYAAERGHRGAVERLLAHKGTDVGFADSAGRTALIHAAERGHKDTVEVLLRDKDIDVNNADGDGDTTLIVTSRGGFPEVVRLLLQHSGTDVSRKNKKGQTALMVAQEQLKHTWKQRRCAEVIELLTEFEQRSASSSN